VSVYDHQFWVTPLANRCWNWRLNEASGTSAADSGNTNAADPLCAPIGSTVVAMPGTLSGSVAFAPGQSGNGASFTGSGGQIKTTGPVLDTTKSFTVTAWVRLPSTWTPAAGSYQTVVSQSGVNASRFSLRYDKDANGGAGGWCFSLRGADSSATTPISACATGAVGDSSPPAAGQWVHLAGVYDQPSGTITVHVMGNQDACNGESVAAPFTGGSWSATDPFMIGSAKGGGSFNWLGDIDGVYAWQRALAAYEVCTQVL
jgi:hypothetical protein